MKKKFLAAAAFIIVIVMFVFAFTACKEEENVVSGEDAYGRVFGEIYDVDSQPEGIFRLPYTIGDTSFIGQTMISANCADYVILRKSEDGYKLTYLCKKGALSAVRKAGDGKYEEGVVSEEGDMQGFTFAIERDELKQKIMLQCVVELRTEPWNIR